MEAVDAMVAQLVKRLWDAERQGRGPFSICITGDHSTPVLFGDHSHEPVPIAVAHVRSAQQPLQTCFLLGSLAAPLLMVPLNVHVRHVVHALGDTAALEGVPLQPIPHPHLEDAGQYLSTRDDVTDQPRRDAAACGDSVCRFDEISGASGALGRLPGCQVMTLVKGLICDAVA